MNKDFDLDKADKQMPYTTSEDFFNKLEESIWKEIKDDYLAIESTSKCKITNKP